MLSPGSDNSQVADPHVVSAADIQIVRGGEAILGLQSVLEELSARCGQAGVLKDVAYYLSKPGLFKRVPYLLLLTRTPQLDLKRLNADDLVGAVLLYHYKVLGCGIGIFTTNDRSGRATLVAPAALRASVAQRASRWLLKSGALAVLISFREENGAEASTTESFPNGLTAGDKAFRWTRRRREIPDYLPLLETFDATLARIGQRTRSNLRYYRRRAESQLGCNYVPAVTMEKAEFLAFNRECMYAVPDKVAAWRYDSLRDLSVPLLMGMKDKDGRWLSLLGGRRHGVETEILWQMNRAGLAINSLSLVMRSYFMEHEIAEGMGRMYIEGGTPHPMRFSFVKDSVTDLVVLRRSPMLMLVSRLAPYFVKHDNELAMMLLDKSVYRESADGALISLETKRKPDSPRYCKLGP